MAIPQWDCFIVLSVSVCVGCLFFKDTEPSHGLVTVMGTSKKVLRTSE
jgi:hypothetical protein